MKQEYLYIGGITMGLGIIVLLVVNMKKSNKSGDAQDAKDIAALLKKIDDAKK